MTVVVDTSALAAVVFGEPDAELLLAIMKRSAGDLQISAATAVELGIVVEARQGQEATDDLHLLITELGVRITPVDVAHVAVAVAAWRRFGKGRHAAGLNLGECFAYALAKIEGAPLLFKGDDFTQTDISIAR